MPHLIARIARRIFGADRMVPTEDLRLSLKDHTAISMRSEYPADQVRFSFRCASTGLRVSVTIPSARAIELGNALGYFATASQLRHQDALRRVLGDDT